LIQAHRYEREHRQPLAAVDIPFTDTEIERGTIYEQQALISGLAHALVKFSDEHHALTDLEALAALTALGETYRTLASGIYYEKPPEAPLPALLYAALAALIQQYKTQTAEKTIATPKDSAIFAVLVYAARLCRTATNGRPRARIFLQLLHAGSPQGQESPGEAPRIIMP
jgi:hypothetical protein